MLSEAKHLNVNSGSTLPLCGHCRTTRSLVRRRIIFPVDHSKLAVVEAFASQAEADLAKSMLESAGIDAMIQADRAGGMRDHLAWSGFGFKLLVRAEDAATARDVLHPPDNLSDAVSRVFFKVPEGKLVVIKTCGTQNDADIAQGALESAGIAAAIVPVPVPFGESIFRVKVREEDAEAAQGVLDASRE